MALPLVLVAIVVIGVLMAGAFFCSTQEYHSGRSAVNQGHALMAAERGLAMVLSRWDSLLGDSALVGQRIEHSFPWHDLASMTTVTQRLSPLGYWVMSEGIVGEGLEMQSERRVGAVVWLDVPRMHLPGALTIHLADDAGSGELGSDLRVAGAESAPVGWLDCQEDVPGRAGFVTDDPARWSRDPACGEECFTGEPPILSDSRLADTAAVASEFDVVWEALLSERAITLPGGTAIGTREWELGPREVNGRCDRSISSNWGDPGRSTSCARYFPIVLAAGDLHIVGGAGQGVLLVDGDLTLSGGATFVGLILVRGALRTVAPGPHVIGAVRVAGQRGARSTLAGGGRFEYSRCALMQSVAPHARPSMEPRSWIELHW